MSSRRPPQGLPRGDPGAELHDAGRRLHRGLPPGRRAVGRCQADGMTHKLQRGWAEQTRSERPASVRHVPARASMDAQVRQHGPVRDVTSRAEVSTLTRKRSPSPGEPAVSGMVGLAMPSHDR